MGIDYRASIMVGLPRKEITNDELIDELIEDEKLEVCASYFDGDSDDDAICGFSYLESKRYVAVELKIDRNEIEELKAKFWDLTGQDARVYLSPRGY